MPSKKRLKVRVLTRLLVMSAFLIVASAGPVVIQFITYSDNILKEKLKQVADYVQETFIYQDTLELEESYENKSSSYLDYLKNIYTLAQNLKVRYIYFMVMRNERIYFILDTDFLDVGFELDEYTEPPEELYEIFIGEKSEAFTMPYTDEYGSFISYFRAMTYNNEIQGVWGFDYDISIILERNITIVLSSISALLISIVSVFIMLSLFNKAVLRPLGKLKSVLAAISEGKGALTQRIAISSDDEIGEIAGYFNQAFAKIQNLVTLINSQSTVLQNGANILSNNLLQTAGVISEINASIQSINNQIINQSSDVEESSHNIRQITAGLEQLNQLIEDETSNALKSSSAIEKMVVNISR